MYGGLVMPLVLPDFRTNSKKGHEERIKDHEQTERSRNAKRRRARIETQASTTMTDAAD